MADKKWQERCRKKRRFWQVHIRAWGKSGLSQNEYCSRNKLKSNQLCYWKKKIKDESRSTVKFVPVPVQRHEMADNPGHVDSGLTIILDDIKIKLSNDFSPEALARAVAVLGGKS